MVSSAPQDKPPRLVSLDLLRGAAVIGMIFVNGSMAFSDTTGAAIFAMFRHSDWSGVTLADMVFPAFLLITGAAIPLSVQPGDRARSQIMRVALRTARLFLLGFLLTNLHWLIWPDDLTWRLWGVLQRIALVYGVCAGLFLVLGPRPRVILAAVLLVLYWWVCLLPSPDGAPTNLALPGYDFPAAIDRLTLGAGQHIYVGGRAGYDPEGLVSTLPAIAQGLIGVAAGEYLRRRSADATRVLALAGAACIAAGLAWSLVFPLSKNLWSSSFVLFTSGATIALLALLHRAFDRPGGVERSQRFAWRVMLVFGANALAAYVLHGVTMRFFRLGVLTQIDAWLAALVGPPLAAVAPVALFLFAIWVPMELLWRRRWFIRI